MDKVRGIQDESGFLSSIPYASDSGAVSYYALDLYTEDMTGMKNQVLIDVTINNDGKAMYPLKSINDDALNLVFKEYNRMFSFKKVVKNKSWNLYIFDKQFAFPDITINYMGKEIKLSNSSTILE